MLCTAQGFVLSDRNYWNPEVFAGMQKQHLYWLAPYKSSKRENHPFPKHLKHKRYRIETMIGQFVERFGSKKIWARDAWHLISRWFRKVLSYTIPADFFGGVRFLFFSVKMRIYLRFNSQVLLLHNYLHIGLINTAIVLTGGNQIITLSLDDKRYAL